LMMGSRAESGTLRRDGRESLAGRQPRRPDMIPCPVLPVKGVPAFPPAALRPKPFNLVAGLFFCRDNRLFFHGRILSPGPCLG